MLEIKNLEKYFGEKKVLKGINVKINDGELVGIIGPSGCGKSSSLSLLYDEEIVFLERVGIGSNNAASQPYGSRGYRTCWQRLDWYCCRW